MLLYNFYHIISFSQIKKKRFFMSCNVLSSPATGGRDYLPEFLSPLAFPPSMSVSTQNVSLVIEDDVVVEEEEDIVVTAYYQINSSRNDSASLTLVIQDVDG